jgi:hypothetical protein
MTTDLERKVIALLRGGRALPEARRRAVIDELGPQARKVLRRIALGELGVPHPKLRRKAIIALSFNERELEQNVDAYRAVLAQGEPTLQVNCLRALERLSTDLLADEVRALVRDPGTPPEVALAAARVAVRLGGDDLAADLGQLRERFLPLVPSPRSPSITSLDQLIAQAEGHAEPPAGDDGPRPVF